MHHHVVQNTDAGPAAGEQEDFAMEWEMVAEVVYGQVVTFQSPLIHGGGRTESLYRNPRFPNVAAFEMADVDLRELCQFLDHTGAGASDGALPGERREPGDLH